MKKFLLTLAAVALAASSMIAQTNTTTPTTQEEPDRVQMRALSKNPTGMDIPTGYDSPQVVAQKKHECKDHKDGQPCTKPADQQCDDCKAKAAAAAKHECKDGQKCEKAAAEKKDCCKDKKMDGQKCDKPADQQCPDCKEKAKKN